MQRSGMPRRKKRREDLVTWLPRYPSAQLDVRAGGAPQVFEVLSWAGICLFVVPADVALLAGPWGPSLAEFLRCVMAYELVLGLIAGRGGHPGDVRLDRRAQDAGDAPAA